jgi:hypothetical protein
MISISTAQQSLYTATFKIPASSAAQAIKTAKNSDTVTISKAAQAAFAATQNSASSANSSAANSVDARLAEIKAKDMITKTAEDMDYLWANDSGLAALRAKMQANPNYNPTAAELDHEQKAIGFVNTMANLSPAEKDLYDKAIASGNKDAAAGISQIAFIRMMGHTAGGPNGATYDPINTEITAANIERYFSHSIVDSSGKAQAQFQALIQYLQSNPASS